MTYRVSKRYQGSLESNYFQVGLESVLADTVNDDVDTMSVGDLVDLCDDIATRQDGVLGAVAAGQGELLLGAGCGDDFGAHGTQQLDEQQADTARGGMDEGPLAGLDLAGLADDGPGRETLQVDSGGLVGSDALGDDDGLGGRDPGELRVGAVDGTHIDDAAAHLDGSRVVGDGYDLAGALVPKGARELGRGVQSGADVGVDVVDAGVLVADEDLAGLEGGDGRIAVLQDVDAAVLVDLDNLGGGGDGGHGGERPAGRG